MSKPSDPHRGAEQNGARDSLARDLYERVEARKPTPLGWDDAGSPEREHYRTLVDVIGEIDRERLPFMVVRADVKRGLASEEVRGTSTLVLGTSAGVEYITDPPQAFVDGISALSLLLHGDPANVDRAAAGAAVEQALVALARMVADLGDAEETIAEIADALPPPKSPEPRERREIVQAVVALSKDAAASQRFDQAAAMLREIGERPMPCGHTVDDLIGSTEKGPYDAAELRPVTHRDRLEAP